MRVPLSKDSLCGGIDSWRVLTDAYGHFAKRTNSERFEIG
jgi:hypothetical protein